MVELSGPELQKLQVACESEGYPNHPGDVVHLAPRSNFVGEPLRAVFDYHIQLGKESEEFKAQLFIVAIEREWKRKGVLLVTLDDHRHECMVDMIRMKVEETGSSCVCYGWKISWDELKSCASKDGQKNDDDDSRLVNEQDSDKTGSAGKRVDALRKQLISRAPV